MTGVQTCALPILIGGIGSGFLWQSVGPGWTLTGSSLVCLLGLLLALRAGSAPARKAGLNDQP